MPASAGMRRAPPTSPLPQLRIGLLNVRGLLTGNGARVIQLAADAATFKLDVLLLTETHVDSGGDEARAADLLSAAAAHDLTPGWRCFWGRASSVHSTGVAILIREDLLTRGLVTVSAPPTAKVPTTTHQRAVALRLCWGGHDLHLLSAYLPNDNAHRVAFMDTTLKPLHETAVAAKLPCLWGGDWNFLECEALDKPQPPPPPGPPPRDPPSLTPTSNSKYFAKNCPGLVDIFRVRQPKCRQWTYLQPTVNGLHASRLDRFYTSPELAPYVLRCGTAGRYQLADHRLVLLDLQARRPSSHGRGLKRVRLHYLRHRDLHARVDSFLLAQTPPAVGDMWTWWLGVRGQWAARMQEMTAVAARRLRGARAAEVAAQAVKARAAADLEAGLPGSQAAYAAAEAAARRESGRLARTVIRSRRTAWLHTRETPSPLLTTLLRPPPTAVTIPSLIHPRSGALLTGPAELPAAMAAHWADISKQLPPNPAARAAVLDAMRARCTTAPPAEAAAAGCPDVTEAEVLAAIKRLPPGTAPGPDGIPIDAYRKHAAALAPLLARVFSYIGAAAAQGVPAPPDFLLGAICFFYKKGAPSDPNNYRPITLLNADYRVLTRALATRMGPVLAKVISPEQSAFLPGRKMGETVWLLQLLPYLLRRYQRQAVLAFLDFAKAYDTVDRSFLYQAMEVLGLGGGLLAWVRALLTGTKAMAIVNGHVSLAVMFLAGVRQGCPMSPPLYLIIGEALLAWLKHKGYGVRVPTSQGEVDVTAGQFADDGIAVVPALDRLPAFDADMTTFGTTTGQFLGRPKVQALRIGAVSGRDPPATSLPYPLVKVASTLGVLFANGPVPAARLKEYWDERLERVSAKYDKLTKVQLSAFGRGFGAGGYGMSMLLYYMEFMGMPPEADVDLLLSRTAELVDKCVSPLAAKRGPHLTGVSLASMQGPPALGGFGVLPLRRHVTARTLWWALTFVRTACSPGALPPWVLVARALLASYMPCATPLALLTPVSATTAAATGTDQPTTSCVVPSVQLNACPPLLRLASALSALPPVRVAAGASPIPPAVARDLPLCGNPYLTDASGLPAEYRFRFAFIAAQPVVTVEQAWGAARSPPPALAPAALQAEHASHASGLLAALPPAWLQCCGQDRPAASLPSAGRAAEEALLSRLTLVASSRSGDPRRRVRLTSVPSVRLLTALQMDEGVSDRRPRVAEYLREAGALPHFGVKQFWRRQAVLWRVPWENERKETLWRLALDGVAFLGAQRFRRGADPLPCWCGAGFVARPHMFWHCYVARVVCASITAALQPLYAPAHYSVRRAQVWLAEPPPGVPPPVWQVVSLAALDSIHHGQDTLTGRCLAARKAAGLPDNKTDRSLHAPARAAAVRHACTVAVARFWSLLEDFASLNLVPPAGWSAYTLRPGHPFFGVLPGGDGRLRATGPPPQAAVEAAVTAVLGPAPPAAVPAVPAPMEGVAS